VYRKSISPIQTMATNGLDLTTVLVRLFLVAAVFSLISGCAHRKQNTPVLLRALPPLLLETPETLSPLPNEVVWAGVVTRHSSLIGTKKEKYLTMALPSSESPVTLRYGLPNGGRIPIEKGDTITVKLYGAARESNEHDGTGIAVFDEQGAPLAFVNEKGGLPESTYLDFFRAKPGKESVYLESKPVDGICSAVLDHRNLLFSSPRSENNLSLNPGATGTLGVGGGSFEITVVDHAVVIDTNCAHRKLDRLSFIGLKLVDEETLPTASTDEE
jgi:hypothetical protein